MHRWQQAARDGLIPGLIAGLGVSLLVASRGRMDSGSAVAPINASSHVLWGDAAAAQERITLRHTLPGALINPGATSFWATVFELLFGRSIDRRGWSAALFGGAVTAGAAYLLDYRLLPARLTPGWERRLSRRSMAMAFGTLAVGLATGAMLRRRTLSRRE